MNAHPLQFDAIVAAPFGAVGIALYHDQVAIELLTEQHAAKAATNQTVQKIVAHIEAYLSHAKTPIHLAIAQLAIAQQGTPYQQRVWQAISAIPAGQVLSYGDIAAHIGSGARAVANACGANNLPLIVPCHRVVAKNGIGGFMQGKPDGLNIKKWLLKHEGVTCKGKLF
jgi:methylated-DNA-[protein]-cysteine S-methyltransferase